MFFKALCKCRNCFNVFKAIEIKSIRKLSPSSTLSRTPSKSSYLCVGFPDRKPTAKLKETLNILIPIDRELRVEKSMEIWAGIIAGISDQTLRQETQPAGAAITPGHCSLSSLGDPFTELIILFKILFLWSPPFSHSTIIVTRVWTGWKVLKVSLLI